MNKITEELENKRKKAVKGGGKKRLDAQHAKGKLSENKISKIRLEAKNLCDQFPVYKLKN